ncbi:non-ribosomal peptide synthetase [Rhodococcoides fascians]|uniref:non-ribosomal peptide synthetase n=1 Tax=Rhodococcoides fascians TaxID=1828 RepID=UPI0018AFB9AC|nr:non-ribosomal peptide synthetase [Rhodococcus fascians]
MTDNRSPDTGRTIPSRKPRPGRPRRVRNTAPLLPQLLTAAVELNPSQIAVAAGAVELSYAELDRQSSQIARLLIASGVGPESVVAIGLTRSLESVLSVWAISKTGAAFVPIDPTYPADRVEHMISDSGVRIGVTTVAYRDQLPDSCTWTVIDDHDFLERMSTVSGERITVSDRVAVVRSDNAAYLIYTSGSSGIPKGVVVTHRGLAVLAAAQKDRYRLTSSARTLHFASPSFDASVLELLLAVAAGSTMVVAPTDIYGGQELSSFLRTSGVTHAFITPAALSSVDPSDLDALATVVVGGEACPPELVELWGGSRSFFNAYGPTETTVVSTISEPLVPGDAVSIGDVVTGTKAHVLDKRLRPVPAGVVGELYLEGAGLARGYESKSGLTASRFVANPTATDGSRMYRTGDLVRRTASGNLEYRGRNDFQVKVRGFRIELGEIDSALSAHDAVSFAVTVGVAGPTGDTVLVAYVRPVAGKQISLPELSSFVAKVLPKHMVPSSIMAIDTVPLTPSGKLDRDSLPDPVFASRAYRAPETDFERAVASVFTDVLGVDEVGVDDDFFELGGNSLSATRLAARIGAALQVQFGVRDVFNDSTVRGLASTAEGLDVGGRIELATRERPERIPLSYAQQRMWFLNRFDESSLAYNIPIAMRLTGKLDRDALAAAVTDLVDRHEVLRTIYPEHNGSGFQRILASSELRAGLDVRSAPEDELLANVTAFVEQGFDVTVEPPLRATLFETAPDDAILVFVAHHIALDGYSIAPMTRDLMQAYAARSAGADHGLPPLAVQYADFAIWQRETLGSELDEKSVIAQQLSYWQKQLKGLPELLELPTDRPRPAHATDAGAVHSFVVDTELATSLGVLAGSRDATLFMVMNAALAIALAKSSGSSDIAVGTAVAGRGEEALDELIGMFVNTLVLRNEIDDAATIIDVIDGSRATALEAFANADLPFERLVEVLDPPRSTAHTPLFQVMLTLQNLETQALQLPGLTVSGIDYGETPSKFDIAVTLTPSADGAITGTVVYAKDLFDEATAASLAGRFLSVMRAAVIDPEQRVRDLDLRSPEEKAALVRWNDTDADVVSADHSLLDAFDRCVRSDPAAPAVTFRTRTLSYGELDRRVEVASRHLIEARVEPETAVAITTNRSFEMVVSVLAILRAGGSYVPVDPGWPQDRTAYVLGVARPVLILADEGEFDQVGAELQIPVRQIGALADEIEIGDVRRPLLRPDNCAYTIFTSGSTGRPKGVSISHRSITSQLDWLASEFDSGRNDAVLQKTPTGFDASVWELFLPLRTGGRLVLADPDGHKDPRYMADLIAAESITIAQFVPSVLTLMPGVARKGEMQSLRAILVGGEQLGAKLASEVRSVSGADVHNVYGPTEATVQITHAASGDADVSVVPIGEPVRGAKLHVLDRGLNEVPVSVVGELYVGGDQLARGYGTRPDLTAERFVANPFDTHGSRLYRTGDLVRRRADGSLVYMGRSDDQVKVNGLRIELGEVETALHANTSVAAAAASIFAGQLVGYVVLAEGFSFDEAQAREQLELVLPEYMVPSRFVVLAQLPSNSSGKLDRRALPEPSVVMSRAYRAPESETEVALAELYEEVLGLEQVGLDDSFFAMGGDSIMSIQLVSRAKARGLVFRPRDVFEAKNVGRLAEIASWSSQEGAATLPELTGGGVGKMPTTPIVDAMLERGSEYGRFTQSVTLELPVGIDRTGVRTTIGAVVDHHDMLRSRLDPAEGTVEVALPGTVDIDRLVYRVECPVDSSDSVVIERGSSALETVLNELDPTSGEVLRFIWIDFGPARAGRIVVVAHHLLVDGVSWRILVPDFVTAWAQYSSGVPVVLQPVGTSMRTWAHALKREARSVSLRSELDHWRSVVDTPDPSLGSRVFDPALDTRSTMKSVAVSIPAKTTGILLTAAPDSIRGGVNDVLLTALAMAVMEFRRRRGTHVPVSLVNLEGHGREEAVVPGADLARTVGWFTTVYPVALDLTGVDLGDAFGAGAGAGVALKSVKEQMATVPNKGIGFGLLRYSSSDSAGPLRGVAPQVSFNYLGRVGAGSGEIPAGSNVGWVPASDFGEIDAPADDLASVALIDINALVVNAQHGEHLEASFSYASGAIESATAEEISQLWVDALEAIATYAQTDGAGGLTPSDVPLVSVSQADIDAWEATYGDVEDIWPLTPLQEGLQFHALAAGDLPDVYMPQIVLTLGGDLDPLRLHTAARATVARHPSIRTAFVQANDGSSVQIVRSGDAVGWTELDLTNVPELDKQVRLRDAIELDRATRFDLTKGPLLRFLLVRLGANDFRLVITDHHIVLDGWSMPILLQEVLALYALRGDDELLARPRPYRGYLGWLGSRDVSESIQAWSDALAGVGTPTLLAGHERATATAWADRDTLIVGVDTTRALTEVAARLHITMNTMVQAAWSLLLAHTLGRTDVVFGATVSGRPAEIDGVESMVGLLINTIPVRVRLRAEDTIATFLQRLQAEQVEMLEHHYVGLSDIKRRVGAGAAFDSLTVFESYPVDASGIAEQAASIDGLAVKAMEFAESTHYPVCLRITSGEQLDIRLEYMQEVVSTEAAQALLRSLETALRAFALDPSAALDSVIGSLEPLDVRRWPDSAQAHPSESTQPERGLARDVNTALAVIRVVLGRDDAEAHDDLAALGMGSLDAVVLSKRLSAAIGRKLSVNRILTAESIMDLASVR